MLPFPAFDAKHFGLLLRQAVALMLLAGAFASRDFEPSPPNNLSRTPTMPPSSYESLTPENWAKDRRKTKAD